VVPLNRNASVRCKFRMNEHTSSDIISFPVQTAYDMGPDSSDVMYQITIRGYFESAAVRIWILGDGFAVMRQDKVIGLRSNVSIVIRMADHDIALRRSPPSGCHNTHTVTRQPVPVRSRFRLLGNEHTPRLDEIGCPPRDPRPD